MWKPQKPPPPPTAQKIVKQCKLILQTQTTQTLHKWTVQSKLSALTLRNVKAVQMINLINYLLQKMLINHQKQPDQLLTLLIEYLKLNVSKCHQHVKLIKYYSEWDYQFEQIYFFALDQRLDEVGLYLRVRQNVLKSDFPKIKKDLLSGVSTDLEKWRSLSEIVFKHKDKDFVSNQFFDVVRFHYQQVKKSQAENINGAQFLKICLIMNEDQNHIDSPHKQKSSNRKKEGVYPEGLMDVFDQTLLQGLSNQDKELIRVLSYKDKNIARLLQDKHTKMVHLIGEQVNELRKDIQHQKKRYVQVVDQKNMLIRMTQRIKQLTLKYIVQPQQNTQFELLRLLDSFNKKHNPKATDVAKTTQIINDRRLIQIIQREQLQKD